MDFRRPLKKTGEWCPGWGSYHSHCDFQSHALPTGLPGHGQRRRALGGGRFIVIPSGPLRPPRKRPKTRGFGPIGVFVLIDAAWNRLGFDSQRVWPAAPPFGGQLSTLI